MDLDRDPQSFPPEPIVGLSNYPWSLVWRSRSGCRHGDRGSVLVVKGEGCETVIFGAFKELWVQCCLSTPRHKNYIIEINRRHPYLLETPGTPTGSDYVDAHVNTTS